MCNQNAAKAFAMRRSGESKATVRSPHLAAVAGGFADFWAVAGRTRLDGKIVDGKTLRALMCWTLRCARAPDMGVSK